MNLAKIILFLLAYGFTILVYMLPPTLVFVLFRKKLKKKLLIILTGILMVTEIVLTVISTFIPPVFDLSDSEYVLTTDDKAAIRYISDDFSPLFPLDPRIVFVTEITDNMAIIWDTHYLFNFDTTHIYGGTPGLYEQLDPQ